MELELELELKLALAMELALVLSAGTPEFKLELELELYGGGGACQLRRMLLLPTLSLPRAGVSRGCRSPRTLPRSLDDRPASTGFAVVVVIAAAAAGGELVLVLLRRRCHCLTVVTGSGVVLLLRLRPLLRPRLRTELTVMSIDCVVGGRRWRGARSVGASVLVVDARPPPPPPLAPMPTPSA